MVKKFQMAFLYVEMTRMMKKIEVITKWKRIEYLKAYNKWQWVKQLSSHNDDVTFFFTTISMNIQKVNLMFSW